jgi:hypothetical protein
MSTVLTVRSQIGSAEDQRESKTAFFRAFFYAWLALIIIKGLFLGAHQRRSIKKCAKYPDDSTHSILYSKVQGKLKNVYTVQYCICSVYFRGLGG